MPVQSGIAGGDIYPARFVKMDSTDGQVVVCASGRSIGISGLSTRRSPYIDSSGKHAASGEPVQFHDAGEETVLELGGTVVPMDRIKPSTAGVGVATTTDQDAYGAIALQNGVSGELIKVKVVYGEASTS